MNLYSKSITKCCLSLLWLWLLCCGRLGSVQGLSFLKNSAPQPFVFAANGKSPRSGSSNATALTRQLITGVIVPNIVNTGSYCICVPAGSCPNPLPTPPTDGSGQLDIRIVNNPTVATTSAPFTCSYGLAACCQAGSYQCGRRYPPPPGSTPASPGQADFGEYPWQAVLLNTGDEYLGSGALITDQHVLTVAHKIGNMPVSSFKIRLGEWDASGTNEPIPSEEFLISRISIHPNFNSNNLQNNVAILKMATRVSLATRSTIGTVCLPTVPFVNQRCYVAGWGKNDFGPTGAFQAILREVDVPLVPNADCQTALRGTRLGSGFLLNNASFICAGGEAGKDACRGDGGSPLVCESNGAWNVVGLVAWGIGCASAGVPGVYVNVATFLPWIQTTIATP